MKKFSLALFCILALSACDSSSTTTNASGDSAGGNTDSGGGGNTGTVGGDAGDGGAGSGDDDTSGGDAGSGGDDTSGGDAGSGGDDTSGGDAGSGGDDTSGGDTGSGGDDTTACAAPSLGNIITQGSGALTDGCIDGDVIDLAAEGGMFGYPVFEGARALGSDLDLSSFPDDAKGLYLYTQGSSPAYVVPYSVDGFYSRAGSLGFVTKGPGIYYLPLTRESTATGLMLNGLNLYALSATSGAVSLSEVTWAHVDDDVTAVAKLHWQDSSLEDAIGGYQDRNLMTLAASGHPLRAMTHILSEDVVGQYKTLVEGVCPAWDGATEWPAVRFVDATSELGQAWTGKQVIIRTEDDPTRPLYVIAVDWTYATNATVSEILSGIESQSFLWPNPQHPNVVDGSCDPNLEVSTDFDALRQQVLDGDVGSDANWDH